jgi:hypothetical protein
LLLLLLLLFLLLWLLFLLLLLLLYQTLAAGEDPGAPRWPCCPSSKAC